MRKKFELRLNLAPKGAPPYYPPMVFGEFLEELTVQIPFQPQISAPVEAA
jgi:hypothetical protein